MENNIIKTKNSESENKRMATTSLLLISFVCLLVFLHMQTNQNQTNYNKKNVELILERYEEVKQTDLSNELHAKIFDIVQTRRDCFASQVTYDARNNTCRKEYTLSIFQLARENIKSAPMLGLFIRCIRECPIAGSLCTGEEGTNEDQCIDMEARCIEFCLDKYWRGGEYADGHSYTENKNAR
ncbi:MAG: hypothetical protein GY729_07065 [Desulfobacteraceae bacterium]|nr:hypothetical protein [Desulfobacteraceae bacterium]